MRPPLIVVLCVSTFTTTFAVGAFPALLPDIGRRAGLLDWQLGLLAGSFGLARMLTDVPAGASVSRHLRAALAISPVLLVIGTLVLASGGPFPVLILGRVTMGVAHALGAVASLTAILRYQHTGALTSALSAFELSAMLGVLGGTTALGLLPAHLPWSTALLIACSPQLLGLALVPLLLAALPRDAPASLESPGQARRHAALTSGVLLPFAAGVALALAYATLEQFEIPLRASREFDLGRTDVARLLMISQVCDIACLLPFGVLADRIGPRRVLGGVLLVFAVGVGLVAFGNVPTMVAGCVFFGVAMAGWTLPLGVLRHVTAPGDVGWRTGLYRVGVDAGIFLGPFLSGLLAGVLPSSLPAVLVVSLAALGLVALRARVPAHR